MTPDEFRRHGRQMVDWIADYMESVEQHAVLSQLEPGAVRERLPDTPPQEGEPFEAILHDLNEIILPGVTHWQSPNFFAYFPANNSGPSILGELASAGLGVQGMLWATSPACTELETHVLDWVREMLDLPVAFSSQDSGGGVIQDTASSATLCALIAARERVTEFRTRDEGVTRTLVAYASRDAHSSIEKAMMIAGLGSEQLRIVGERTIDPQRLRTAIEDDRQAGRIPCFVAATLGATSTGLCDPLPQVGDICRDEKVWLHVDAAMAGTAAICPEFRTMHEGVEFADSYCFNPHKWLFVNFDCDCFYVRDRSALVRALSILPEYLRNSATESGKVIDYRDWQIPLGRRFRALKLWFVIRSFGVEELQRRIREHVGLAERFAAWVDADRRFQLTLPRQLNLVCFHCPAGDEVTQGVMETVNRSGEMYLTHTRIDERFVLRMSIGQTNTTLMHVEAAFERLQSAFDEITSDAHPTG